VSGASTSRIALLWLFVVTHFFSADPAYKPDGSYIPRIFFVRDGAVLSLHNEGGNPQYKFYYSSDDQIIASMKAALVK
jgi:hypothetical protein